MNDDYIDVTKLPGQNISKYIDEHFLHLCKNKSVVEIGPYDGWISELIIKHQPYNLTLLEANKNSVGHLKSNPNLKLCNVLLGDMHSDLNQVGPVDVAVVLGVIYHSHAPLLVLEELVNHCDPQTVLLDNPGQKFYWSEEPINDPGMRHTVTDKKTCGIVITIDEAMIVTAMTHLGYRLHVKHFLPENSSFKGKLVPIYQFEKQWIN